MGLFKYTPAQWDLAQQDFVEGAGNLAIISKKHNINYLTLRNRALRESWQQKRKGRTEAIVDQRAPAAKPITYILDAPGLVMSPERALAVRERYDALIERLLASAERLLDECDSIAELAPERAAAALCAAVKAADRVRDMLGIPTSGSRRPLPVKSAGSGPRLLQPVEE